MSSTPSNPIKLAYSIADQNFARTKSIGILNFSSSLLAALARQPQRADVTALTNSTLTASVNLPERTAAKFFDYAADSGAGRMWWDQFGAYSAARATGAEWLFLPKGFASFARRCPLRLAVFVHDLMHDHYRRNHPGNVPITEEIYFKAALRASLRHAEIVFTPTDFTAQEIRRVCAENGWPTPGKIIRCGEGFSPVSETTGERRDIVVLAGKFPHKLTRLAVDFMSRWQKQSKFAHATHWVGSLPTGLELPALPGWKQHPRLSPEDFCECMSHARAVLFFSDYEGFGLPPVEAVLAGACPVYSEIPATREVMGGRGCAFDNGSYENFADALNRALVTSGEQLRRWGDELLARHNWNATVDCILTAMSGGDPAR